MFVIPILIVVAAGVIIYGLLHRQPRAAAVAVGATPAVAHAPHVWPTSPSGIVALGALGLAIVSIALVNVVQVPYLSWILPIAALGSSAVARWVQHDRSSSVLIVFIASAFAVLAAVLFLAGEVLFPHD